jgi:uncharacterized protein
MRTATLLYLLAVPTLLVPTMLVCQQNERKADSEIRTAGSGEVTLSPQRAVLSIGITTRAATAAEASSHNARVTNTVLDTLVRAGFRRDSLQTVAFGVGPNYDYDSGHKLVDYEATATIRAKVRDLARIGRVIDQALAAGATDISNVIYESDSLEIGRRQALAQALGKARDDARALAVAAGGALGRLLDVNATDAYPYAYALDAFSASGMQVRGGATSISPRDVAVRVAVQTRWEFIPNR